MSAATSATGTATAATGKLLPPSSPLLPLLLLGATTAQALVLRLPGWHRGFAPHSEKLAPGGAWAQSPGLPGCNTTFSRLASCNQLVGITPVKLLLGSSLHGAAAGSRPEDSEAAGGSGALEHCCAGAALLPGFA